MKREITFLSLFLVIVLAIAGCQKNSIDETGLNGTTLDASEELSQLPQIPQASIGGAAQQGAIEVLPIETSPVTPSIAGSTSEALGSFSETGSSTGLSYNQKIQMALKNAGLYTGNVDGKVGPMTRKAIETFQTDNGLKVDGKVGPMTWAKLETYLGAGSAAGTETAANFE